MGVFWDSGRFIFSAFFFLEPTILGEGTVAGRADCWSEDAREGSSTSSRWRDCPFRVLSQDARVRSQPIATLELDAAG